MPKKIQVSKKSADLIIEDVKYKTMDDRNTSGVRPVVQRSEDFKEKNPQKKFFSGPRESVEKQEEEAPRRPVPLPFGKIDVIA